VGVPVGARAVFEADDAHRHPPWLLCPQ
jgi:hypothetical protein